MQVMEATMVAKQLGLVGPIVDQCEYNMFTREAVETDGQELFDRTGLTAVDLSDTKVSSIGEVRSPHIPRPHGPLVGTDHHSAWAQGAISHCASLHTVLFPSWLTDIGRVRATPSLPRPYQALPLIPTSLPNTTT